MHIPVCLNKCDYCDFFSVPLSQYPANTCTHIFNPLITALLNEITFRRNEYSINDWKTIYIGGGTPSLLSPENIYRLGKGILTGIENTDSNPVECTVEANPEDLTEEWLDACSKAGINRLSLGIQSLNDGILENIGRRGTGKTNRRALEITKKKWKGNFSLDLISGLPDQNLQDLLHDIDEIIFYKPDHISLYSLTVEPNTPLGKKLDESSNFNIPNDDESASLWIAGRDYLKQKGYFQYEVSNFALKGFESRHNMTYWNLDSYIGVGPGATGTIITGDTANRTTNTHDISRWLEEPESSFTVEYINKTDCIREVILMGMRLSSGLNRKKFLHRFGIDILGLIGNTLKKWSEKKMLIITPKSIALNEDGLLILNRFLEDCFDELP